ncbi:hypothetical protein RALTA_B0451 [Cupriavidus taiwanensis LMG 19424]|uniref:Uncharacterized protein n=1 Tax=Cupriavidus taiwanensis (strain DSM 17343 / BCRC 17206 / CCUG 44338 / CIP 107171 / LMG 19424 / R1) TaxID=977880 RepID=B2AIP6_CUPTR|nr:hypothetical protein RALTA_B0451 [Cupriavidus taiwanensis LMG 19424]
MIPALPSLSQNDNGVSHFDNAVAMGKADHLMTTRSRSGPPGPPGEVQRQLWRADTCNLIHHALWPAKPSWPGAVVISET